MELQKYFSKFLLKQRKKQLTERDYFLSTELTKMLGTEVQNIALYREAFSLKSSSKNQDGSNYERLEFLGDSVLGAVISCHLFHTYPQANEGYLTQMKSKIVNRKNLNKLGEDLKLTDLLQKQSSVALGENICGNLFEALVGAVYLDFQYETCKKIILERLLTPSEINKLENKIVSYKGLLLEWSQKKKLNIKYETCEEIQVNKATVFRCHVWLGDERIANATETSKKKAEEKAAQRAFYILNKKENILGNSKTI
ncbi:MULTISPECIES: ribonuclease III [Chryseobacterium]|uniref:Ribonuclease 3 n=1 Tax=Chryseobacterium camelliae TaxID=1265445 RepID=A0ABU0TL20_9FLAO|nr:MULTISPECIES: ribonuclease III [Chryseobacterium]MDT3408412.1 ribonuclease-3 [Pseudacidovorax intermedius]MDQ1097732.1 ribonuclease-3 [Chryseobacterium camelliae]MDQ1101664.1 ribonuclease-3 [Chryseobacterium sp. SORGH_AS_1048]MDR6085104.1 ribonuclease-3 [Chryseobacterium sp. SORGH_AS_0909]MDR6129459.1 ribonuclease-3 [Chryseobacterium sp. SORGH_AS_1175]